MLLCTCAKLYPLSDCRHYCLIRGGMFSYSILFYLELAGDKFGKRLCRAILSSMSLSK